MSRESVPTACGLTGVGDNFVEMIALIIGAWSLLSILSVHGASGQFVAILLWCAAWRAGANLPLFLINPVLELVCHFSVDLKMKTLLIFITLAKAAQLVGSSIINIFFFLILFKKSNLEFKASKIFDLY